MLLLPPMPIGGSAHPNGRAARKKLLFAVVLVALWLPLVVGGMVFLWRHSTTAGAPGNPPTSWPRHAGLERDPNSMALVMVVHPHCPCSRASIGELAELMAHTQNRLQAWVMFVRPGTYADDWVKTDLWRSATAIPGVKAIVDDGREARRFGAETSGETLLYDANGKLMFAGGITGARGHYGDNAGLTAVIDLVGKPDSIRTAKTAVYGCPLFAPSKVREGGVKSCSR